MHFGCQLRNAKGITLIALIITIVVLILLATVTLNIATNRGGLVKQATNAKKLTNSAAEKEKLLILEVASIGTNGKINIESLKANINNSDGEMTSDNATDFPLVVTYSSTGNRYFIFDDGTITEYDAEAVARIGNKSYKTLQAAINDVATNNIEKEVILLKNVSEDVSVLENQNVKLNLNSKTVSATDNENRDCVISTRGKLTITGNGTVTGKPIAVRCIYTGNLRIINGTYEGTTNSVRKTDDDSNVTIDGGTYTAQVPMRCWGKNDFIINGGTFEGIDNAVRTGDDVNLTINGGNFYAETNSTLHIDNRSNVTINNGVFNSGRIDWVWDGIIQHSGTGTLIIGSIGDNNNNILINSDNNTQICGIYITKVSAATTINSGTIAGYVGINIESDNTDIYLNGGSITGNGGTVENVSGWSCAAKYENENNKIYLKRNTGIILSGRGYTGKNSIMDKNKRVVEVD